MFPADPALLLLCRIVLHFKAVHSPPICPYVLINPVSDAPGDSPPFPLPRSVTSPSRHLTRNPDVVNDRGACVVRVWGPWAGIRRFLGGWFRVTPQQRSGASCPQKAVLHSTPLAGLRVAASPPRRTSAATPFPQTARSPSLASLSAFLLSFITNR